MSYLKQKLEEKHITQKELAIRTGIDKGSINYYCNKELKEEVDKPLGDIENTCDTFILVNIKDVKTILKELDSLQITNELLYKTNKDLIEKQMQNIENIGTIELLGNEKWSIE